MKYKTLAIILICCVVVVTLVAFLFISDELIFIEGHYSSSRAGRCWVPDRWWHANHYYAIQAFGWSLIPTSILFGLALCRDWCTFDIEPYYTGENLRKHNERLRELALKEKKN